MEATIHINSVKDAKLKEIDEFKNWEISYLFCWTRDTYNKLTTTVEWMQTTNLSQLQIQVKKSQRI